MLQVSTVSRHGMYDFERGDPSEGDKFRSTTLGLVQPKTSKILHVVGYLWYYREIFCRKSFPCGTNHNKKKFIPTSMGANLGGMGEMHPPPIYFMEEKNSPYEPISFPQYRKMINFAKSPPQYPKMVDFAKSSPDA